MRRLMTALVLVTALAGGVESADAATPDHERLSEMDEVMESGMEANGAPGSALAVTTDQRVVHTRGFGKADSTGSRVTTDTPFLLGSTTKSFTALAVMQLVEAGKVRLDAPVRRYVPELRLKGNTADRITVRQVLQHTSGLPSNAAGGPILKSAGNGTAAQAIAELQGEEPAAAPGTEMEYVNANYVLAGLVVERASGEPYGTYLRRHVFAPLGMTRSFTSSRAAQRAGLAAGHRYAYGFTDQTGPLFRPGMLATGYVMSSANDMGRYLAMYLREGVGLNGKRILSPEGVRVLTRPGRHETELGPWAEHSTSHYAMGWFVGGPWKEPAALHPGAAADSSALIALFPRRRLAVVTLVNASSVLPVPGNPVAITRMERNAIDSLLGEPVDTGTSVRGFYLRVDLALALLIGLGLLGLGRAVRDVKQGRRCRRPVWALLGVVTRFALAATVLSYPLLTGLGWTAMRVWHPDLALALAVLGAVLLVTAVLRLVSLARHTRRARPVAAPA